MRKQHRHNNRLTRFVKVCTVIGALGLLGPLTYASSDSADFLRMNIPAASASQAAGVALNGGSYALNWNPAGILGQQYPSLALTHFTSFADTAYEQLDGVYPHWLEGHWGIKLFFAKTYDFFETDSLGDATSIIDNSDSLLQVTYARHIGNGLSAGASAKFFYSMLAGFDRQGAALDLGVQYKFLNDMLSVGLTGQNLGVMSEFDQSQESLPIMTIAGLGLDISPLPGQRLQLAADYNLPIDTFADGYLSLGMAYQPFKFITLRGGYRIDNQTLGNLSFGGSLKLFKVGLDYAFQPYADLGNSHRVTLTYHFEPTPPKAEPTAVPVKMEPKFSESKLSEKYLSQPRLMKGKYEFLVPQVNEKVKSWTFEVRDQQGKLIRKFVSNKSKPKSFIWDGRDEQGKVVPKLVNYKFVLKADNKTQKTTTLPKIAPVLKLWFADGSKVEADVIWDFYKQPEIKQWVLSILDRKTKVTIQQLRGNGELPDEIIWDGKDKNRELAKSNRYYDYHLALTYPDGQVLTMSEAIEAVASKTVKAPENQIGLLIYGILYDFNRTKLKPVMENKVLMVSRLLYKYKQAKAVCEGKADRVGSDTYNWNLSYRRAKSVAHFLSQQKGVAKAQVDVVGYGEKKLWAKEKSKKSQTLNRRVDIKVLIPKDNKAASPTKKSSK